MNGEDFYEEFKASLKYLDVPWGKKELVAVAVHGDRILMAYGGRDVSFTVGSSEGPSPSSVPTSHQSHAFDSAT